MSQGLEGPVTTWLKKIGLGELANKFYENGYRDLVTVSQLTKEDLKEIDVVAGFAKTIITHASLLSKVEQPKETIKETEETDDKTPTKRRKRCMICHNYSSKGHKKICSGKCGDYEKCPTQWLEQHKDEHEKVKQDKVNAKKEESTKKKKQKEEERKKKKEESEQYKKIPLTSWNDFYERHKGATTENYLEKLNLTTSKSNNWSLLLRKSTRII